MVFQSYALFPHLTVGENIGFGLARPPGAASETQERRVNAAAELVGCGDLLERQPVPSSRAASGSASPSPARSCAEPDVFLLDEPLSNLDAQLRVHMRAELKQLHQRLGATMVYVTHDQVEALTLGDRVAVLNDGRPPAGRRRPTEIYRRPANRFVAHVHRQPGDEHLPGSRSRTASSSRPVRPRPRRRLAQGREARAGIRPGAGPRQLGRPEGSPAEVEVVENAGNETFLHLDAGGARIVVRAGAESSARVGSTVASAPTPSTSTSSTPRRARPSTADAMLRSRERRRARGRCSRRTSSGSSCWSPSRR